jgi:hypothetical protein
MRALVSLWPKAVSYAVSYLFIAIVWTNHHHLMRYATEATPYPMWFNFAYLFSVSLLPLSTAWMAASKLATQPVAFYAAIFFLVNATYICLIYELIDRVARRPSRGCDGYQPRGSEATARASHPELDRNHASTIDRCARQEPATMSVLQRCNCKTVTAQKFMTQ